MAYSELWKDEKHGYMTQTDGWSGNVLNPAFKMHMLLSQFHSGPTKQTAATDLWVLEEGIS
jgi:hypothetical protein